MNVNVKPDAALKKKLAAGTLTIPDRVLLALAEAAAGLLPEAAVYTVPIRQDAKLPALFVGFYEIHNAQKLDDLSEYTFGFDLAYCPRTAGPTQSCGARCTPSAAACTGSHGRMKST